MIPPRDQSRAVPAAAALVSLFVFALSANALPAALLRAADEFRIPFTALAQVSAVQFTGFFLAAVVGGVLSDIFGKRRVLQVACLLLGAGALVWTAAPGRGVAFVGGGLMGIGGGILESMASSLLCDLFPDRRKFFLNLSQVMYCAGAVAGPLAMSWLLPRGVSWRWFFGAIALSGATVLVLYSLSHIARPSHAERIHFGAMRKIGRRAAFWVPCVVLFCYVLTESGVVFFANAYLQTTHGAPERWAIASLSAFWIAMAAGRWACALIPERVSYRRVVTWLMVGAAAALALQQTAGGWIAGFALFALAGLALAGAWPLVVGMSAKWNPDYSGTVLGVTIAIGALGCVAAPPLMAWLMRVLPSAAVFPVSGLPLLLAAGLLIAYRGPTEPR